MALHFSVIIPTLNEARYLPACLEALRQSLPTAEVIVVDGGSVDGTEAIAERAGARVVRSAASRGGQCRAGAEHARGDVLCFLHADARLGSDAEAGLRAFFAAPERGVATMRVVYPTTRPMYRLLSFGSRFDSVLSSLGDQGILVRRALYDAVGGMPALPLFEDVELFRRLRRLTRVHSIPLCLHVSTRRFDARGLYRQLAFNLGLTVLYAAGVPPERLAVWYGARETSGPSALQEPCVQRP